jgi:hypothetical protein
MIKGLAEFDLKKRQRTYNKHFLLCTYATTTL